MFENLFKKNKEEYSDNQNPLEYKPSAGPMRDKEINKIIELSKKEEKNVEMNFNGIKIEIDGDSSPEVVELFYQFARRIGLEKIGPDFEIPTDPEVLRKYADILEQKEEKRKMEEKRLKEEVKVIEEEREKIKEKIKNIEPRIADGISLDELNSNNYAAQAMINEVLDWIRYMQVEMDENNGVLTEDIVRQGKILLPSATSSGNSFNYAKFMVKKIWKDSKKFSDIIDN